jgi:hypothetical protein
MPVPRTAIPQVLIARITSNRFQRQRQVGGQLDRTVMCFRHSGASLGSRRWRVADGFSICVGGRRHQRVGAGKGPAIDRVALPVRAPVASARRIDLHESCCARASFACHLNDAYAQAGRPEPSLKVLQRARADVLPDLSDLDIQRVG